MKDTAYAHDFTSLRPHISRCLLRQLCKEIVTRNVNKQIRIEVVDELLTPTNPSGTEHIQRFYGALMFVDISGFTALSTKLDIESLTTHINDYFRDMLAIIVNFRGDVVKFAGDAMYVVWNAQSFEEREIVVSRAVACGKDIIRKCSSRSVSLLPTSRGSSTPTTIFKLNLTQSLLTGHSALERGDNDFDFSSSDGDDTPRSYGPFLPGSEEESSVNSPRSSKPSSVSRRGSAVSEIHAIHATKIRRLSMPSLNITSGKNRSITMSESSEISSLNVHIGISVGVLAGVDVCAKGKAEYFLTGQPLLDVSAAESLAMLGELVVSMDVYGVLTRAQNTQNKYECVSTEFGCYRIEEPLFLSEYEESLREGPPIDIKSELTSMMALAGWDAQEISRQFPMLVRTISSYVHEAARMQSPAESRPASPPLHGIGMQLQPDHCHHFIDNSSLFSSASSHSEDSFEVHCGNDRDVVVGSGSSTARLERMQSFENGELPCGSMSAELRELVVLFIKIDVDVSLSHHANANAGHGNTKRNVNVDNTSFESSTGRFVTDKFGFLERSNEDVVADVALHERLQSCMTILADTFAENGGQIGTYSCCDKGNVCLATFGLRGSVQEDNAAAAIESAQTVLVCLQALGLNAGIGVASGKVYGGLVGSPLRHEYSIMGPAANLSARLMCAATAGSILCDSTTRSRDRTHQYLQMPLVSVKGYSDPVNTFQPILSESSRRRLSSISGSFIVGADRGKFESKKYDSSGNLAVDMSGLNINSPDNESCVFGRNEEISAVINFLRPKQCLVSNTQGKEKEKEKEKEAMKIAIVTGACGSGKTVFLSAVKNQLLGEASFCLDDGSVSKDKRISILSGSSNSYDTAVPFNSWKAVLMALFVLVSQQAIEKSSFVSADDKNKKTASEKSLVSERQSRHGSFVDIQSLVPVPNILTSDCKVPADNKKAERRGGLNSSSSMSGSGSGSVESPHPNRPMTPTSDASRSSQGTSKRSSAASQSTVDTTPGRSFDHLRNGSKMIIEALPPTLLPSLPLIFKLLPSFAKSAKKMKLKIAEPTVTGPAKLQKTVEVLSVLIQIAVDLLDTTIVFITL